MRQVTTAECKPASECPVRTIAIQAQRYIAEHYAADRGQIAASREGDKQKAEIFHQRMPSLWDAICEMQAAASYLQATSPEGVLFQAALVHMHADVLNPTINLISRKQRVEAAEAVARLAYLICSYIEAQTGTSRHDIGLEYYLGRGVDHIGPAAPVREAA